MEIVLLFVVVVAINAVAVYEQRRFRLYTQLFGANDWTAHATLLSIVWAFFVLGLVLIEPPIWQLPASLRPLGVLAALIGIYMIAASESRLGITGTFNGRFFGRSPKKHLKGGVFNFQNPMYMGFILLFMGVAFWQKNAFYLGLAVLSFLLLNIFLAHIERP